MAPFVVCLPRQQPGLSSCISALLAESVVRTIMHRGRLLASAEEGLRVACTWDT